MLDKLKGEISETPAAEEDSWYNAVFGPEYLYGTSVLLVISLMCQFSGYNHFNMFSVRIFTQLNEKSSKETII